jgi:hypothetical protein
VVLQSVLEVLGNFPGILPVLLNQLSEGFIEVGVLLECLSEYMGRCVECCSRKDCQKSLNERCGPAERMGPVRCWDLEDRGIDVGREEGKLGIVNELHPAGKEG